MFKKDIYLLNYLIFKFYKISIIQIRLIRYNTANIPVNN